MNEHPENPMGKYNHAVRQAQIMLQDYRHALLYMRHAKLARDAARLGYVNFADQVLDEMLGGKG